MKIVEVKHPLVKHKLGLMREHNTSKHQTLPQAGAGSGRQQGGKRAHPE